MAASAVKILLKRDTFVIIDESTMTHHCHSKSIVILGFITLGVVHPMGLGKTIMTYIYHYGIIAVVSPP